MFDISTYIWGIRYGFKEKHALYPEKVRLSDPEKIKEYDLIVQSFTEEKDAWFRNCKRDFYFMHETNGYKLYSLVVSNHNDIAGRKSFIVFSLVCPTGKSLIGNVTEVLNQLKALYKEKNADETIDRNLFTAEQVNRLVQTLSVGNQISSQNASYSIFHIKNDDVSKVFHDYVGNEIYYIIEGSNAEMINSMPNHFKQRKFSDRIPTGPSPFPSTGIPTPPTPPSPGPTPGGDKGAGTGAHSAIKEKLDKIIQACEKAKKNNWHDDILEIDKQIKQEPQLEITLKENFLEIHANLVDWRKFKYQLLGESVQTQFDNLYAELYENLSESERKKKIEKDLQKFHEKVDNLKIKVNALDNKSEVYRKLTIDNIKYTNLVIDKTWAPAPTKNRKTLILTLLLVGLTLFIGVWGIISVVNAKHKKVEKGKENGGHPEVIIDSTKNNNDADDEEVSSDSVEIPFEGQIYLLDKEFTSENGMLWVNGSNYRYINPTWQIQKNPPNGDWSNSKDIEIRHLLNKLVENGKAKKMGDKKRGEKNNPNSDNDVDDGGHSLSFPPPPPTAADTYWITLSTLSTAELEARSNEIKSNYNNQTMQPSNETGRTAKTKVWNTIK